jgi:hypothetical protein
VKIDSDDLHSIGVYLLQEFGQENLYLEVMLISDFISEDTKMESKCWNLFFLEATLGFL